MYMYMYMRLETPKPTTTLKTKEIGSIQTAQHCILDTYSIETVLLADLCTCDSAQVDELSHMYMYTHIHVHVHVYMCVHVHVVHTCMNKTAVHALPGLLYKDCTCTYPVDGSMSS